MRTAVSLLVLLPALLMCVHGALDALPPPPVCGNGRLEAHEGCDDGNRFAGDGCDASCAVEPGWACHVPRRSSHAEPGTCHAKKLCDGSLMSRAPGEPRTVHVPVDAA